MSIEIANGEKIRVSKIGKWFLYGFVVTTLVVNLRGIVGFMHSLA